MQNFGRGNGVARQNIGRLQPGQQVLKRVVHSVATLVGQGFSPDIDYINNGRMRKVVP